MDDDSEVNIATCSKIMKRKRNTDTRVKKMRLDKDLGRSFNSKIESCSNGKPEFLKKEQSEAENVETMSDSVDSDESDVWPMLKQSSVKGDTNDVHENSILRDINHPGIYITRIQKSGLTKAGKKSGIPVHFATNSKHTFPIIYYQNNIMGNQR
jgi:hypothetical protein